MDPLASPAPASTPQGPHSPYLAQLWVRVAGLRYEMFAEGQRRFFLKAVDAQIAFTLDPAGSVTGPTLTYGGMEYKARRAQ